MFVFVFLEISLCYYCFSCYNYWYLCIVPLLRKVGVYLYEIMHHTEAILKILMKSLLRNTLDYLRVQFRNGNVPVFSGLDISRYPGISASRILGSAIIPYCDLYGLSYGPAPEINSLVNFKNNSSDCESAFGIENSFI